MESLGPNAISQDLTRVSHGEKISPSSHSNEGLVPPEVMPRPPDDPNADQDREYGCKYCQKKFSNKQALGGHQNAHKLERAVEKNAREVQENLGFFGGAFYPGMASTNPLLGSHNRSHAVLNRAIMNRTNPSQQPLQQGIHMGYNPRPGQPVSCDPYPPGPLPGFNNVHSGTGLAAPVPRVPQFPRQPSPYIQNQVSDCRVLNLGPRSSIVRPITDLGLSTCAGLRLRHGANRVVENNWMNDPGNQHVDNSGLDLSLKL